MTDHPSDTPMPTNNPHHHAAASAHSNLPLYLTSFIGRERERADVKELLQTSRVLTLVGAPGVGKSRFALEVATDLLDHFHDGAWLVELAPLADPGLVTQAVATTIGLREQAGDPPLQKLVDHLQSKEVLLVLDNCEHLLDSCAHLVYALLRACPHVQILATSREALGIDGERVWRVPSLSLPLAPFRQDPARSLSLEQLARYEAVQLFVERARDGQPGFALTEQNASEVAQICIHLDGIPLALELAAARVSVLAVKQIAARLDERFRMLTGGNRVALARQQTLKATLDWSYQLLCEAEQVLLRRVSVFAGGWTLEAAEAVCTDERVGAGNVLDVLTQLVKKSLVHVVPQQDQNRYYLLESMRQYGHDRLLEAEEVANVQIRHARWCLSLTEQTDLDSAHPERRLERLEAEHDNLRAVLGWSLAQREEQWLEMALRLSLKLFALWNMRAYLSEGRHWLELALAKTSAVCAGGILPLRAEVMCKTGVIAHYQGDYPSATTLLEESLALWKSLENPGGQAEALCILGHTLALQGQTERALPLLEEGLETCHACGNQKAFARTLNSLGMALHLQGDQKQAALRLQEGLELNRALGEKEGICQALNLLGEVARASRKYALAQTYYEESITMLREIGPKTELPGRLGNLGAVAAFRGNQAEATALLTQGLRLCQETESWRGLASFLVWFAEVAGMQRREARVARLLGGVQATLDTGLHLDLADRLEYERLLEKMLDQLDTATFEQFLNEGRNMTREQLITYALEPAEGALPSPPPQKEQVTPPPALVPASTLYPDGLSAREVDVLRLVATGLTNARIAEQLVISPRTVDAHLTSIYGKIRVKSRTAATLYALAHQLA